MATSGVPRLKPSPFVGGRLCPSRRSWLRDSLSNYVALVARIENVRCTIVVRALWMLFIMVYALP